MIKKWIRTIEKNRIWIAVIAAVFILSYYVSEHWFQLILILGDSMRPSYHHMQLVVLNKYDRTYTYGDVIAFYSSELHEILVKRIVAMPGDTVQIVDGTMYVDGRISKVYPDDGIFQYAGMASREIKLAGEYFVIGDNLSESKDSRYEEIGLVDVESVFGKVVPAKP